MVVEAPAVAEFQFCSVSSGLLLLHAEAKTGGKFMEKIHEMNLVGDFKINKHKYQAFLL